MCSFIMCEIMGWEPSAWRYKLSALIPAPGILGALFWKELAIWLPVPTSAICGPLLPIAYVGFFLLHYNAKYMGKAMPQGRVRLGWNLGIGIAVLLSGANAIYYVVNRAPPFLTAHFGP